MSTSTGISKLPDLQTRLNWKVLPDDPAEGLAVLKDLDAFFNLDAETRDHLSREFCRREKPYRFPAPHERDAIRGATRIVDDVIVSIGRLVRYFLRHVGLRNISLADIQEDLRISGFSDQHCNLVTSFFTPILEAHPEITKELREQNAASLSMPTVDGIGITENLRAVYDINDRLISVVPVPIVRLVLEEMNNKHEVVFQLSASHLDDLCDALTKHRDRLTEFSQHVSFSPGDAK